MLGAALPPDVESFYAISNGMPDNDYDEHHVCFWSIERIARERHDWPGSRGLSFADFLINSWCFELFIADAHVRVWVDGTGESAGPFIDFLERYVDNPSSFPIL